MPTLKQQFGQKNEELAVQILTKAGYQILEQNYRTKMGEIDIIAREKDTIIFVEVKARRSERYGHPKYALTISKQKKISRTALTWLKKNYPGQIRARFDVVTILWQHPKQPEIEIIKNAFGLIL